MVGPQLSAPGRREEVRGDRNSSEKERGLGWGHTGSWMDGAPGALLRHRPVAVITHVPAVVLRGNASHLLALPPPDPSPNALSSSFSLKLLCILQHPLPSPHALRLPLSLIGPC